VKESLFGIIQFEIEGKHVLDLFAGSGSLGFEALSRGASFAMLNDISAESARIIKQNAEKLGFAECVDITQLDYSVATREAKRRKKRFDIVFLDPPYTAGIYANAVDALIEADVLNDNCIVVAEHDKKRPPDISSLNLDDRRLYGDVGISIYRGGSI